MNIKARRCEDDTIIKWLGVDLNFKKFKNPNYYIDVKLYNRDQLRRFLKLANNDIKIELWQIKEMIQCFKMDSYTRFDIAFMYNDDYLSIEL